MSTSRRDAPAEEAVQSDFADKLGGFVARNPRKIVAFFIVLFIASLPALYSLSSFLSIYELLPTGDYYDANFVLNQELGADNVMFMLTTPESADNVTTVPALREMDHILTRMEEISYVQSTVSLPGLVKGLNFIMTGNFELPPDTPEGNFRTEQLFNQALVLFGETLVYDNVLTRDHQAGIQLIVMDKGHDLQQYRDWQVELKSLAADLDVANPYFENTKNQPISIDVIYANLDAVAIEEGPFWIMAAAGMAIISSFVILDKKWFETLLALFVLTVAIAVTITAGFLVGVHFNLLTMLLIALILGAGIDYAMHVIARYLEERHLGYGVQEAITQSARHVGSALFITTVTTVVGFVSLFFSRIQAIGQFGIMVGAGMFTAYIACITLLPAMLQLHDQRLIAKGKRVDAIVSTPEEAASRRHELEESLREKQRRGPMGRLAEANQQHPMAIIVVFLVVTAGMTAVVLANGVSIWGASYIDPPILDETTYPMEVLNTLNHTFGIPAEGAIVFEGDMTRPATLAYISRIEDEMLGRTPCDDADEDGIPAAADQDDSGTCIDLERRDHGILNGMSTAGIVRLLYPTLGIPNNGQDDQWSMDSDGDGEQDSCPDSTPSGSRCPDNIPDTHAALRQFYDYITDHPAVKGVLLRTLSDDYQYGVVRYFFRAQPEVGPLNAMGSAGTDVDNYKISHAQLYEDIAIVQAEYEERGEEIPETSPVTSLIATGVEVNEAIKRGNSMSTYMMLVTTFIMIFLFWRHTVPTLVTMIPVLFSIGVQYFIIALFGYEVTYVSIILTGMALGIGIDDAVHLVTRFKEEMTQGRSAREAAVLANSEIGRVLIATTVTTLAPFAVITASVIIWAQNTAWMTIPTLTSALLATIFLLPVLLRWHGERWPHQWVTKVDLKRAGLSARPASDAAVDAS